MIKPCPLCRGKGKRTLISRMSFSSDGSDMETAELVCHQCEGEGKIYIVPASKAPKEERTHD